MLTPFAEDRSLRGAKRVVLATLARREIARYAREEYARYARGREIARYARDECSLRSRKKSSLTGCWSSLREER